MSIVEPELENRDQFADRILSKIIATLAAMRSIAVQAAGETMRDEERAACQGDIERLKNEISRLTAALSQLPPAPQGMTDDERAACLSLVERSVGEVVQMMDDGSGENIAPHDKFTHEKSLSRWFDDMTKSGKME